MVQSVSCHKYDTMDLNEAMEFFLVETINFLNDLELEYVVVGGWSPYLLNSQESKISHPGTHDIDVMFDDAVEETQLKEVVTAFLEEDFFLSAKHDFQLLKPVIVGEKKFIFSVDLLHPSEELEQPEMFVDHLELEVTDTVKDLEEKQKKMVRSIAMPMAQLIFEHDLLCDKRVEANDDGAEVTLIDEAGLILTKIASWKSPKRPRDAFDIFLALDQAREQGKVIECLRGILNSDRTSAAYEDFSKAMGEFVTNLEDRRTQEKFNGNVKQFLNKEEKESLDRKPSSVVLRGLKNGGIEGEGSLEFFLNALSRIVRLRC